jgi:hypothetical protein
MRRLPPLEIGSRFGLLTVKRQDSIDTYTCLCDCGGWKVAQAARLRHGHTRSCGCLRREHAIALGHTRKGKNVIRKSPTRVSRIGEWQLYGSWLTIRPVPGAETDSARKWLCRCVCGNYALISASKLAANPTPEEWADHQAALATWRENGERPADMPKQKRGSRACGCHVLQWAKRQLIKAQGMVDYQQRLANDRLARTAKLREEYGCDDSENESLYKAARLEANAKRKEAMKACRPDTLADEP